MYILFAKMPTRTHGIGADRHLAAAPRKKGHHPSLTPNAAGVR
jgi:hypothetical protein